MPAQHLPPRRNQWQGVLTWRQGLPCSTVGDRRGTQLRLHPLAPDSSSQANMHDSRPIMSSFEA